ncbi:Crp/Fnr family transcriptional regulator [Nitratifractor sp.]
MKSLESSLAGTALFGKIDGETLSRMFSSAREVEYAKGESIENDEGMEWFNVLLSGRVKLLQTDLSTGRSFVPFLLERGDVFDIISLVDGAPHLTTPVTLLPTTLLRVPMGVARGWLEIPAFNEALLPYLGDKMRDLECFAESVVFDDTLTRLARIILHHAKGREGEERPLAVRDISHELLAEMIGSVRSVVTSQLKKLDEDGLILRQRGRIIVKDLKELIRQYGL